MSALGTSNHITQENRFASRCRISQFCSKEEQRLGLKNTLDKSFETRHSSSEWTIFNWLN